MKIALRDAAEDLQLLALLVSRELRESHGVESAPMLADYYLEPNTRRFTGMRDVLVLIKLGRNLSVEIMESWGCTHELEIDTIVTSARELASEIINVTHSSAELRQFLSEIRAATKREIKKAARKGLVYELIDVAPQIVNAGIPADYVATVRIRIMGETLGQESFGFQAEYEGDVRFAFDSIEEEQSHRATRRAELASMSVAGRSATVAI